MLRATQTFRGTENGRFLPEALRHSIALPCNDIAAALACIILFGMTLHHAATAFLSLAATFAIAVAVGRYRVSFAVTPRDEWYQAAAVAFAGGLVGVTLCAIFGFEWWYAIAASAIWSTVAGSIGAILQSSRRGRRHYEPKREFLHRTQAQRSTILETSIIRGFDVLFALVVLIVGAPVMAAAAVLIATEDGRPILFRQRRVGRDDVDFTMFKFRTMQRRSGEAWVKPGDTRITRLGALLRRTSLDELPQVYNILRGQMSFIGPRPEMREYAERFAQQLPMYSLRHLVRPGLSGWAQLHLPRNLEPEDAPLVLSYDLFFAENVCVYLYLYCVVKTVCEIFAHRAV
jgi:lipopolysaccharide/colanic/teichoic acid biosynthesis glycosyltransferase